jgi:hypothetical protein
MNYHSRDFAADTPDAQSLRRRADRCHELAKGAKSRGISEALIELADALHSAARAAEMVEKQSIH